MISIRPGPSMSERIALGITAAWVIGIPAVGIAELVLTGKGLLETGGAWQSWVVGGIVATLAFAGVICWGRRQSASPDLRITGNARYKVYRPTLGFDASVNAARASNEEVARSAPTCDRPGPKKVRQADELDEVYLRAYAITFVVVGAAIPLVEMVLTGREVLEYGVSWQTWVVAGVAAVWSFAVVVARYRRKARRTESAIAENDVQCD